MTIERYMEIMGLFNDNPQKLIDDEVKLNFAEVEGEVIVIDGVAAGEGWIVFKFVSGPFTGREIACIQDFNEDGTVSAEYYYSAHATSDGMSFNIDKSRGEGLEDWGGQYFEEWDGKTFTVCGGDCD